ncbi:CARDB domain-containing protein [Methylomonas sp. MgM2]
MSAVNKLFKSVYVLYSFITARFVAKECKSILFLFTAIIGIFVMPSSSNADFFQNQSGLSESHATISFDEHIFPNESVITTEYSDLQIRFSPFAYYFSSAWDGPGVASFLPNRPAPGARVIQFTQPQAGAAFQFWTYDGAIGTFQALLNGNVVESATAPVGGSLPNNFYGFRGIKFDAISISTNAWPAWGIDNIQHQIFRWVPTGIVSDCSGNDINSLTAGVSPDPVQCNASTIGLAAVCWNQTTYTMPSATTPVCTYKSVTPESCVGGAYPGTVYQCQISQANEVFGNVVKTVSFYEYTFEQNIPKNVTFQLVNSGNAVHTATLEIVNPFSNLTISITEPNPINLAAGETKSISLSIDPGALPIGSYDGILLKITADDGSVSYSNVKVNVVAQGAGNLPDLTLSAGDIGFSVANPGDQVTLSATIHNQGYSGSDNVLVRFFEFGALLGETVVPEVTASGTANASISVPMDPSGDHLVRVVIDPDGAIPEIDEANNEASQIIQPGGATVETSGNMLVSGSLPTTVYSNSLFTLSGKAVYDVLVNGVRNTDYVVKGGSVQITVTGENNAEWIYGGIHTDTNGNFVKSIQAPPNTGTYHIAMTVTDKTFIGKRELVFNVVEPLPPGSPEPAPPIPPMTSGVGYWAFVGGGPGGSSGTWVWTWTTPPTEAVPQTDLRVFSENIHFSKNHPAKDEEITIFAEINYWATNTDLIAEDVPVNIYVTYPGNPSLKIGEALIKQMSVGSPDFGSRYVYATWRNRDEGIHLVEVEIDPSFVEENQFNNAATRAIIVGKLQAMQGAIAGQVTDAWGNGIGNVIIDVTEVGGASLANTTTDPAGFYLIGYVPLGAMIVHIEKPTGYQADAENKATEVVDSAVSTVNFMLTTQAVPADNTPPVLSLPADIIAEATGPDGAIVTFSATANDVVDGPITPTCMPVSGDMFALGSTNVSCSATDKAGNTANGSFNVTVRDTMSPVLVCPADVSVMQGQQPVLGTPSVLDSVDPSPQLSNNAPANFSTGNTAVIWSATDASGNQASCAQQVTVSPVAANLPPVANAGLDQTVRQGSLVTLNGNGIDPDNGPSSLAFVWSQTGGSAVTLNGQGMAQPTFKPSSDGVYIFQLIVNDGADDSAPDEVQINVPLLCDIDQDGDVDRNDTSLITAARNQPALPGDLRDYDDDGIITVNDARACVLKCTRNRCAP